MKKVLICALDNGNPDSLTRLIKSVEQQHKYQESHEFEYRGVVCSASPNISDSSKPTPSVNTDGYAQRIASSFAWDYIQLPASDCIGKVKNSILEQFSLAYLDFDYLLLLESPDFLYPSAFQQIHRLLLGSPDVVGVQCPDSINTRNVSSPLGDCSEPVSNKTIDQIVLHTRWPNTSHGNQCDALRLCQYGYWPTPKIILFSHDASVRLRYGENLNSDFILAINAQYEYLRGNLSYINTFAPAIYVQDKTECVILLEDPPVLDLLDMKSLAHMFIVLNDFQASEIPHVLPRQPEYFTEEYRLNFLKIFVGQDIGVKTI